MGAIRPVIGITLGDPAGIGPEVTRAALASGRLDPGFEYRVLGEAEGGDWSPGRPTPASARAALDSLRRSVAELRAGALAAVVNAPVSKERLYPHGFPFPGQTEFYADAFGVTDYAMMLTGPHLTVALVTAHAPVAAVPGLLRREEIFRVGALLARYVLQTAGPSGSRTVLVAGLNPHAGEGGTMGREEIEAITPAVRELQSAWSGQIGFEGPLSPDTLFRRAVQERVGGVLCMYHDQGLIPLKLLDFEEGVNHTLGLPVVRTSPDHGTAFEIAGRGLASPGSMIAALRLAARLARSGARAG